MLKEWAADKHQEGPRFSLSVKVKECIKAGWPKRKTDCTDYVDSWLAGDKFRCPYTVYIAKLLQNVLTVYPQSALNLRHICVLHVSFFFTWFWLSSLTLTKRNTLTQIFRFYLARGNGYLMQCRQPSF